jgi:hypothetical protein
MAHMKGSTKKMEDWWFSPSLWCGELENFLAVGTQWSSNEPKITKTNLILDAYNSADPLITWKH